METKEEQQLDIRFAKIGSNLLNVRSIERILLLDEEAYLSTVAGNEYVLEHNPDESCDQAMKRIARRFDEHAHDLIYLEAFAKSNEELLSEDQASNLLYRQWLERRNNPIDRTKLKGFKWKRGKEDI